MDCWQIEVGLQHWQPWVDSIKNAREELGFSPSFPREEMTSWEDKHGWAIVFGKAKEALDELVLPRINAAYWVACFCSDYDPERPETYFHIKLPKRVKPVMVAEGIPGTALILFQGMASYYPQVEKGRVTIKIVENSEGERILPFFPFKIGVPLPLGLGVSPTEQAKKSYVGTPAVQPPWTKLIIRYPTSFEPSPPNISPYITIRIPIFALGYSEQIFKMSRNELKALIAWWGRSHPLQEMIKRGRSSSCYKEWAIEKILQAEDKRKAFNDVCQVLRLIEQENERRGKTKGPHDVSQRDKQKQKAAVDRRVRTWLAQAGLSIHSK